MKRSHDGEMVKGYPELLVLGLLCGGESLHGYLIRQRLIDQSNHALSLSFGRLYPLLAEMEKKGWVRSRNETVCESRIRKSYTITPRGRTELGHRVRKWNRFAAGVERILGSGGNSASRDPS